MFPNPTQTNTRPVAPQLYHSLAGCPKIICPWCQKNPLTLAASLSCFVSGGRAEPAEARRILRPARQKDKYQNRTYLHFNPVPEEALDRGERMVFFECLTRS